MSPPELPFTAMAIICWAAIVLLAVPAAEDEACQLIRVHPGQRRQTVEGWGTSLCWWAHLVGGWSSEAKKAELMDLLFDRDRGLGLNVVRYNIGGGDHSENARFYRPGGAMPGFRPDPGQPYDWEADANQRWVLLESIKRGVTITEAFSNSPPWWMTESGSATGKGERNATECNLREDMYGEFADYLTEVTRHYRDQYGVVFDTLCPLNEPTADWWSFGNNQEGCRFGVREQERILHEVARQLTEKGLSTRLAGPEEFSIDWTINTWTQYGETTRSLLDQVNTHTYHGSPGKREELRRVAEQDGTRLAVSEYGNGVESELGSALELARIIALDLNELRPVSWVYWQVVEPLDWEHHWGLIHTNYADETQPWVVRKQYWALLHFTRHICPGSSILDVSGEDVVAALTAEGNLILIALNRDDERRSVVFDLSRFPGLSRTADQSRTTESEDHRQLDPIPLAADGLSVTLSPKSINTFVVRVRPEG